MRKLDLSDTKSIRAFAEGFLAGKAPESNYKSRKLGVGEAASSEITSDPYIRTIIFPMDRFCHMNQQGRELAKGW